MDTAKYLVSWRIDVEPEDAGSPEEAARFALDCIIRPGSIAHVFEVVDLDTGEYTQVDLDDQEEPAV